MTLARTSTMALVAAALLSPLGCGVGTDASDPGVAAEALTGPSVVANMSPSGVVESTGNLYWTRNRSTVFPRSYSAQVYRAAKTNVPGQETILYQESSIEPFSFGNITFANVGGVWYGYFIATYRIGGTVIKRVPLDGSSAAVTLGSAGQWASAGSPLQTDGTYLYYYGSDGMYAATMDASSAWLLYSVSGVTSFGIDSQHIYFAAGTTVYRTFKPNVTFYTSAIATTTDPVTQVAVQPGAPSDASTIVYFAAGQNILQYKQTTGGTSGFTNPTGFGLVYAQTTTSLSIGGTNVLWTWCDAGAHCSVGYRGEADWIGFGTLKGVASGARQVVGDTTRIFYVDNSAFERFSY
jgi:hypothetical protein